jgi:hypothetical protein
LQRSFDASEDEEEASEKITNLAKWTDLDKNKVSLNEYHRLIDTFPSEDRLSIRRSMSRARESTPANLRILLEEIYKGHCQVCNFWFLKKDKNPYFEIHHLDPLRGHHPKNLLVVCGNCHNQFEYAPLKQDFNSDGWLVRVSFKENILPVKQAALITKKEVFLKELFT